MSLSKECLSKLCRLDLSRIYQLVQRWYIKLKVSGGILGLGTLHSIGKLQLVISPNSNNPLMIFIIFLQHIF